MAAVPGNQFFDFVPAVFLQRAGHDERLAQNAIGSVCLAPIIDGIAVTIYDGLYVFCSKTCSSCDAWAS